MAQHVPAMVEELVSQQVAQDADDVEEDSPECLERQLDESVTNLHQCLRVMATIASDPHAKDSEDDGDATLEDVDDDDAAFASDPFVAGFLQPYILGGLPATLHPRYALNKGRGPRESWISPSSAIDVSSLSLRKPVFGSAAGVGEPAAEAERGGGGRGRGGRPAQAAGAVAGVFTAGPRGAAAGA
eukprot:8840698-Pyramimonas_sp.AAC.1